MDSRQFARQLADLDGTMWDRLPMIIPTFWGHSQAPSAFYYCHSPRCRTSASARGPSLVRNFVVGAPPTRVLAEGRPVYCADSTTSTHSLGFVRGHWAQTAIASWRARANSRAAQSQVCWRA